jgi:N-hydroxyarylamine O-acetyltransferase
VSGLDLAAYLRRIGYGAPPSASAESLAGLHEAHAAAIPFENLDILLGRPISLDLADLQAKIVAGRRGGYCFEQNTLFQAVLEAVGFEVTALAARVRGGGVVRPRTHMLLRVELGGGPSLADVGFGGDGPVRPLPLAAGPESWLEGTGYRLQREGEAWVLSASFAGGEWTDLYTFSMEPQLPVDFVMANHFTSTWPRSPFVQSLTAQRSWRARRVILRNRDFTIREGGAVRTETIRDPDHLLEVLGQEFGLSFPAGTRFSRPDF